MLSKVVDALLTEDHVGPALLDGIHHPADDVLLLLQEGLQLRGVRDLYPSIELRLFDLQGRVHEGNLGVLDVLGHAWVDPLLVDDDSLHHLCVGDATPLLLGDLDVVLVYCPLVADLLANRPDSLDSYVR